MLKSLSKHLLLFLVLFAGVLFNAYSQITDIDKELLLNHESSSNYHKHHVHYLFEGKNAFIKFNPVSLFLGGTMYLYQALLSPQIAAGCLYDPSCSNYSKAAISEFGIVKGVCLSADRLTRCSKLGLVEIHPLRFDPETGKVHEDMDMFKVKHP